jgi:hypothetical protein
MISYLRQVRMYVCTYVYHGVLHEVQVEYIAPDPYLLIRYRESQRAPAASGGGSYRFSTDGY